MASIYMASESRFSASMASKGIGHAFAYRVQGVVLLPAVAWLNYLGRRQGLIAPSGWGWAMAAWRRGQGARLVYGVPEVRGINSRFRETEHLELVQDGFLQQYVLLLVAAVERTSADYRRVVHLIIVLIG